MKYIRRLLWFMATRQRQRDSYRNPRNQPGRHGHREIFRFSKTFQKRGSGATCAGSSLSSLRYRIALRWLDQRDVHRHFSLLCFAAPHSHASFDTALQSSFHKIRYERHDRRHSECLGQSWHRASVLRFRSACRELRLADRYNDLDWNGSAHCALRRACHPPLQPLQK